jgi:orotate phosphoribosyltransferase
VSLADIIVGTGAFKTGEFTLASGETSSYYVDAKLASCDPIVLATLAEHASAYMPGHDAVAGTVLGGVPLATAIAMETGRPLLMVRPEKKEHGTGRQVEGPALQGANVLVAEDVVTTGGSLIDAIQAVREDGYTVRHAVTIVDREAGAREALATARRSMREVSRPYALLVSRGTFAAAEVERDADPSEKEPGAGGGARPGTRGSHRTAGRIGHGREAALDRVLDALGGDEAVVATTGKLSRELYERRERTGTGHGRDFLNVGAMGSATPIGLGAALAETRQGVSGQQR